MAQMRTEDALKAVLLQLESREGRYREEALDALTDEGITVARVVVDEIFVDRKAGGGVSGPGRKGPAKVTHEPAEFTPTEGGAPFLHRIPARRRRSPWPSRRPTGG
ncbi:MAG: hypothetical protein IIA14_06905 [SAR324 cluster bacterium]|nr:hypothetical protein [SAR324 cluster bacterium]